jgi:hypothetical protein
MGAIFIMRRNILALGVLPYYSIPKESNHSGGHGGASYSHTVHGGHGSSVQAGSNLKASFTFTSGEAKANTNVELNIQITDNESNLIKDFERSHEKLLHLIVVNKDLSYFNHIHPEFDGNGNFKINTSFLNGGGYKFFADILPKGGTSTTLSEWVKVEGEEKAQEPMEADTKLVKVVDGKEIELTISSTTAKDEVTLTFNILDAQTKNEISDLEQYLGAVGHVVILSDDAEQYLHVHPMDEKATGPKAEFMTSFPKSGTYKIWGQFQHQGKIFTVAFVVDIK